jgi:subtilisin family serine protease
MNSNLYDSINKISTCTDPDNDYISFLLGDSPDSCIPDDASTQDPLYEGSQWMFEMINIMDVWENYGLTGKGVTIRINDDGVYVDHLEFSDRFDDRENSCVDYLPDDPSKDSHGTAVTGIILGNANNNLCSVGIAHEATFSSCNFFTTGSLSSLLAYKLETFDISQNSIGLPYVTRTNELFACFRLFG